MNSRYIKNIEQDINLLIEDRNELLKKAYQIQQESVNRYKDIEYSVDERDIEYIKEYILGNSLKGTIKSIKGYIKNTDTLKKILQEANIPLHEQEKIIELNNQLNKAHIRYNKNKTYTTDKNIEYLNNFFKKEILRLWYSTEPVLNINDITYIISNKCSISRDVIQDYVLDTLQLRKSKCEANDLRKLKKITKNIEATKQIKKQELAQKEVEDVEPIQKQDFKQTIESIFSKDYTIDTTQEDLDYYIKELNIAFNYCNVHTNTKQDNIKKRNNAKNKNIDLYFIWEEDFNLIPQFIHNLIQNKVYNHELLNKVSNDVIVINNKKYRKTFKRAEDVKIGDKIISRDNIVTDVIAKSDIHIPNRAFKIILEDGTEQIASDDHLWPVIINEEYSKKILDILLKVDIHKQLLEDIFELMKNFSPADYFNKEFNQYEWSEDLFKKHLKKIQETKELEWRLNTETIYDKFKNREELYLIHNQQGKKLIKDVIEVEPEKSVCLTVNDNDRVFELENGLLTGNSVLLNNVENACLLRPDKWLLMICDMKRVEGSRFMQFGVPVGVTYESCAKVLQFAQKVMMDRYDLMVKYGVNDYDDLPPEQQSQAIMVIVDEAAELFAPITGKDDVAKENGEYQAAALQATESIYRLGRASKTHVMTFAQRPSSSDSGISMTIRQNASTRIGCGRLPSTISQMVYEDGFGSRIPSSPKGRVGLMINNKQMVLQGFYAPSDWLSNYLKEQGKPLQIYESQCMIKEYEKITSESEDVEIEGAMSDEEFEELSKMLQE